MGPGADFWRYDILYVTAKVPRDALPPASKQRVPSTVESFDIQIELSMRVSDDKKIVEVQTNDDNFIVRVSGSDDLEVGSMLLRPVVSQDGPVSDKRFPYTRYPEEATLKPDPKRAWIYHGRCNEDLVLKGLAGKGATFHIALDFAELKDGEKRWLGRANLGALVVIPTATVLELRGENVRAVSSKDKRLREYKSDSPGCFITTAVCEHVGLPDDCWELAAMRRFRDRWAARDEANLAMVHAYYRDAPAIAQALSMRPDGPRVSAALYLKFIMPMALMASLRLDRLVVPYYKRMVRRVRWLTSN